MKKYLPAGNPGISTLIVVVAAYFTVCLNVPFFRNSYRVFSGETGGWLFLTSLSLLLFGVTILLLSLLCFRFLSKPVLIILILTAAVSNFYMYRFNIVIDTTMLTNIRETDIREIRDLLSLDFFLQIALFGILPAVLVLKCNIRCQHFGKEIWQRLKLISFALVLMAGSIAPFTSWYSSFFREHKALRYYSNPVTALYSGGKYLSALLTTNTPAEITKIGMDAHIPLADQDRELIILVVGEAVRADHLGLNSYARNTTPRLQKNAVISLSTLYSCGTATAYSLPCMFSLNEREDFKLSEAGNQENLLDVLTHAGVNVLWRDNNSDSKGLASNIQFEDFTTEENNPACDTECRDIGMLRGLEGYISEHPEGDIVIVLHQMGNHGPAYYKRFPEEFAAFFPYCHSNRLETCSDEEIINAYDNAVLYTDYFLSQVIALLKTYDDSFETAMFYMSDHGESLGENGVYLHGLPYYFAPDNQKHVASVLWFGDNYEVNRDSVALNASRQLSHDNYFHTVLGLLEIQTGIYRQDMDIIRTPALNISRR